jgi:hypothetical protein
VRFSRVTGHGQWARVQIAYTNTNKAAQYAQLRVNGQGPTAIALPPTRLAPGTIMVQVTLDRTDGTNVLTFSSDGEGMPAIQSVSVQ